jgi:hypothetical protein
MRHHRHQHHFEWWLAPVYACVFMFWACFWILKLYALIFIYAWKGGAALTRWGAAEYRSRQQVRAVAASTHPRP